MSRDALAQAAATCGNFGPGFDVFSLAHTFPGDRVRVREASEDRVTVVGPHAEGIPASWVDNCAAVAVEFLRRRAGLSQSLHVEVHKAIPPGSGLGSSASSSAAGALAFSAAFAGEFPFTPDALLEAAAAGERAVAGDHRDDVAAALFGGLAVVSPPPLPAQRVLPPAHLRLALLRPHVVLETKRMRAVVPAAIPRADIVGNLAAVARMVDACHRGDVPAIGGACVDNLATPYRKAFIPRFDEVRAAAMGAGAYGFALCGSGPSMFAVADSDAGARHVLGAMREVYEKAGLAHDAHVVGPCLEVKGHAT